MRGLLILEQRSKTMKRFCLLVLLLSISCASRQPREGAFSKGDLLEKLPKDEIASIIADYSFTELDKLRVRRVLSANKMKLYLKPAGNYGPQEFAFLKEIEDVPSFSGMETFRNSNIEQYWPAKYFIVDKEIVILRNEFGKPARTVYVFRSSRLDEFEKKLLKHGLSLEAVLFNEGVEFYGKSGGTRKYRIDGNETTVEAIEIKYLMINGIFRKPIFFEHIINEILEDKMYPAWVDLMKAVFNNAKDIQNLRKNFIKVTHEVISEYANSDPKSDSAAREIQFYKALLTNNPSRIDALAVEMLNGWLRLCKAEFDSLYAMPESSHRRNELLTLWEYNAFFFYRKDRMNEKLKFILQAIITDEVSKDDVKKFGYVSLNMLDGLNTPCQKIMRKVIVNKRLIIEK